MKVREVVVNPNTWPPAGVYGIPPIDRSIMVNPPDATQPQALDVTGVDQATFDRINAQYGLNVDMRMKKLVERMEAEREGETVSSANRAATLSAEVGSLVGARRRLSVNLLNRPP